MKIEISQEERVAYARYVEGDSDSPARVAVANEIYEGRHDDKVYDYHAALMLQTPERKGFKAGWRTHAVGTETHPAKYLDGAEETDWQEYQRLGLVDYLKSVLVEDDTTEDGPTVHHLGAALQAIADQHADVLTPRQAKALYLAAQKLWES